VTSDARARPQDEEVAPSDRAADDGPFDGASADLPGDHRSDAADQYGGTDDTATDDTTTDDTTTDDTTTDEPTGTSRRGRGRRGARGSSDDDGPRTRSRLSVPLVPTLSVLLLLLLAGAAFLWFTRPDPSAVRTGDYAGALQAARSGVVDMTSFDYLTLDDDITQIKRVATGDLRDQAVGQLDSRRQAITDSETVVNTEVVGAGVTRAGDSDATVLLVIQSTQHSNASQQDQIVRYRIQVDLVKQGGRWVLSSIAGTEQP
jgi:hypothetical protein